MLRQHRGYRMTRVLILLLTLTVSLTSFSPQAPAVECGSALCRMVASGNLLGLRWPDFSDYRTRVRSFYEPTGYTFAWIRDGSVTASGRGGYRGVPKGGSQGFGPRRL